MVRTAGSACDTRCQLFHKEMIKNENAIRMKWFLRNQQRLLDDLREPKFMKQAKKVIAESEKHDRKKCIDKPIVQQKILPKWRPFKSDGTVDINIMKPVDPNIRAALYEKEVSTFTATNNYLTKRYKELPEKRFYFPDCASWVCGWRLNDYPPISFSKIGLESVMLNQFYQRKGFNLKRDPIWHRGCQMKKARNFN